MKTILLVSVLFILNTKAFSQALPIYHQSNNHQFLTNPAAAGAEEKAVAGVSVCSSNHSFYNKMFQGSEVVYGFSKINNTKITAGGIFFNETIGIFRTTGGAATFAYHFIFKNDKQLSVGTSLFLYNESINVGIMGILEKPSSNSYGGDPLFPSNKRTYHKNIDLGIMYNTKKFYAGISLGQILKQERSLFTNNIPRDVFIQTGYKITLTEAIKIEPSIFFRGHYSLLSPRLKVYYNDLFWIGGSYDMESYLDGFSLTAGVKYNRFQLGYFYSTSIYNGIILFDSYSHELSLRVDLFKPEPKKNID